MWWDNGELKQKSFYKRGKTNGRSTFWYDNGSMRQDGNYLNGKPHGIIKSWYRNGSKKQEIRFLDGVATKSEKFWSEDGSLLIENNIRDGKRNGLCTIYSGSEKIGETYFKDNKETGPAKVFSGNEIFECQRFFPNSSQEAKASTAYLRKEIGRVKNLLIKNISESYKSGKITKEKYLEYMKNFDL
jgi:antitoxin component YwqK of YwqJK toxin-antitoxin module